jgi:hypothetical protein
VRTNISNLEHLNSKSSFVCLLMATVQRLFQTTSRAVLPSFGSSRTLVHRSALRLTIVRYNSTAANAKPAPVNSTSKSSQNEPIPLPDVKGHDGTTDWSRSYAGLSVQPFSKEVAEILQAPIEPLNIEIKPGVLLFSIIFVLHLRFQDGLLYLPEIKYRRILNKAFGPGGWGLAPRSETNVGPKIVSREYALVCFGRLEFYFSVTPVRSNVIGLSALLEESRSISIRLA